MAIKSRFNKTRRPLTPKQRWMQFIMAAVFAAIATYLTMCTGDTKLGRKVEEQPAASTPAPAGTQGARGAAEALR
jgi:hypothetical protein